MCNINDTIGITLHFILYKLKHIIQKSTNREKEKHNLSELQFQVEVNTCNPSRQTYP